MLPVVLQLEATWHQGGIWEKTQEIYADQRKSFGRLDKRLISFRKS